MELAIGVGPPRLHHMQLVVLRGAQGRDIVVKEWGNGGGGVDGSIEYREMLSNTRL